jgi:hypothetical protein
VIAGNTIVRDPTFAPGAIEIFGADTCDAQDIVIAGNQLLSGRLHLRNVENVVVTNNIVIGGAQASPVVDVAIESKGDFVTFADNLVIRTSTTGAAVLSVSHASGVAPRRVTIHGNVLEQITPNAVAIVASVPDVAVTANYLGTTSSSGTYSIQFLPTIAAIDRVLVADNVVSGTLISGFRFSPNTNFGIGRISVSGNVVTGAASGVGFDGATNGFPTIPIVVNNSFTGSDFAGFPSASLPVIAVGGNLGTSASGALVGPAILTGTGAPTTSAAVGSLYQRRDSVAGPMLYVRETSTSWVGK